MASFRDQQQFFYSSSPSSNFSGSIQYNEGGNRFEFDESEIWNNNNNSINSNPDQFSDQISSSSSYSTKSYQSVPIPITANGRLLRKSASTINRNGNRKNKPPSSSSTSSPPPPSTFNGHPPSSSLPVNIPDWSKIMGSAGHGGQYHPAAASSKWDQAAAAGGGGYYNYNNSNGNGNGNNGEEDQDEEEDWVPPHEYTARQLARRSGMVVAFSVHEGVGRTLKGRDLSRVRNAIWKQTGFED